MRNSKGEAEWRALVSEQERSGQSAKAFCAARGIGLESFYSRRSTLRGSGKREFAIVGSGARVTLEIAGVPVTVLREDLKVVLEALR